MAMVAAALRREGKRVIAVRSSILYDRRNCKMHLARINDQSRTNQLNLYLQKTTPLLGTLRPDHTFNNGYKKHGVGYPECRYASAAKFSTTHGEEANQGDDESRYIRQRATPIRIGGTLGAKAVSILFRTWASHSVINARTAKALCLETEPTTPTTVIMGRKRYTCDTKCVIDWQMHNLNFSWTFLVMPLASKWDMVLGVDFMETVSPLVFDVVKRFIIISMPDGPYELREDGSSTKLKVFPG